MMQADQVGWFGFPSRFKKRPFPLKLMAFGLLVFTILCGLRVGTAFTTGGVVTGYAPAPLPLYWIISGALWGVIGLIALIFLWLKYTWSLWLIGTGSALFTAWFWLDMAFLQVNPDRWRSWLVTLIINILILIFIYSTIIYLHPGKQAGSGEDPQ